MWCNACDDGTYFYPSPSTICIKTCSIPLHVRHNSRIDCHIAIAVVSWGLFIIMERSSLQCIYRHNDEAAASNYVCEKWLSRGR